MRSGRWLFSVEIDLHIKHLGCVLTVWRKAKLRRMQRVNCL